MVPPQRIGVGSDAVRAVCLLCFSLGTFAFEGVQLLSRRTQNHTLPLGHPVLSPWTLAGLSPALIHRSVIAMCDVCGEESVILADFVTTVVCLERAALFCPM